MSNPKPFNLVRWFSVLNLLCIGLVGIVTSLLLSSFLTDKMLKRDAALTMQFVQSIAEVQGTAGFFAGKQGARDENQLEEFFAHVSTLPDVLRANVYATDRTLIWSSTPELIGKKFGANPELDGALAGQLEIKSGVVGKEKAPKAEHIFLGAPARFVENYVPVWNTTGQEVIGVVEVYRIPNALFDAITRGIAMIWASAIVGGFFLYACLYWLVRRADLIIRAQQEKLLESETLAVVGELAGAVAHGIRNPLAAIRSSAELMQTGASGGAREFAQDIVSEVDRLEGWVRDLLTYSEPEHGSVEKVALDRVIGRSLENYQGEITRRGIHLTMEVPSSLPPVQADGTLLMQAFNSLFANALEAMPSGGDLSVSGRLDGKGGQVDVTIRDSGIGIPQDQLEKVFQPFHTTKPRGLGVGLPLVKRVVRRFGGSIGIASEEGQGTTVTLMLPVAG